MCRRFHITDSEPLHELLRALDADLGPLPTRYNIAPTDQVVAVHNFENQRIISDMRWGLIPHWVKEIDSRYLLFNARAESLNDSRAYRGTLENKRALIPATSYLEWRRNENLVDMFDVRPANIPLAFAAVWDYWTDDVAHVFSCSILTTPSSDGYAALRSRMPVMLDQDGARAWLDHATSTADLRALCAPRLVDRLEVRPVDRKIGDGRKKEAPEISGAPFSVQDASLS